MNNENDKWYKKPMRIFDVIIPEEKELLKIDLKDLSKAYADMHFNAQHIEVIDIKLGGSDKVYFKSENAESSADLLDTVVHENRRNGIRNFVYVNVHWSAQSMVEKHPEWMQINIDGETLPSGYGVGAIFCVNTAFTEWAKSLIADIAEYDIDGIFLDGPFFKTEGCFCSECKKKFKALYGYELGSGVYSEKTKYMDFLKFKRECLAEFVRECSDILKSKKPGAVIYMNGIQLSPDKYCSRNNNVIIPYQDILGAEGGFLYHNLRDTTIFKPGMTAKLIETQSDGKPMVVFIAGRWSPWTRTLLTAPESWIVHAEAVANGASTWYGTHVENYRDEAIKEIGKINAFLEKNDKYSYGSHSLAKTAIIWSGKTANFYQATAFKTDFTAGRKEDSDRYKSDMMADFQGWYDILSRNHIVFDVIDDYAVENKDISKYKTLILPNVSCMSGQEAEKLRDFVRSGGNIVSTYDTSMYDELGEELDRPRLDDVMGLSLVEGRDIYKHDHIEYERSCFTEGIIQSFIATPNLCLKVASRTGTEGYMVLKEKQPSVYCDIMPPTKYPLIVSNSYGKGRSVYFAGNVGSCYFKYQIPEYKRICGNAVRLLNGPEIEMPGQVDSVDISYRTNGSVNILHVINYTGMMTRPIEKVLALKDVRLRIYDAGIKSVYDTKREKSLQLERLDGYIEVVLPELLEYEVYILEI